MDKLNIACILEEIDPNKTMGNNIRLIKLLKYLPDNFKFEIYTIKVKEKYYIYSFTNTKIIQIECLNFFMVKKFFSRRNFIKKVFWYFINYYSTIDYFWAIKACNQIIKKREKYDLLFLQIPSLLNIIYGWYLKKRTNLPLIFDLRDDLICYKERLFIFLLEKIMVKNTDLITCTTQASFSNLYNKYPKYKNKLVYIPNGVDFSELLSISQKQKKTYFDNTKINIVYSGSMYKSRIQIFKKIIKAITDLIQEFKINQNDFQIHFFPGCKNIFNYSWISHYEGISNKEQYNKMLKDADILLSVNYNTPFSIPGKLYEFLAVSPFVWHFDNSTVCNEVLDLFNCSKLYLDTEMSTFQHDFIQLLKKKKEFKSMKSLENNYPTEFVQKFSRYEIARKYGNILSDLKKKGVTHHV